MIITVIHIDKRWQSQETLTEDNKSKETLVEIEIIAKVDKSKETLVETETTIKVFSNSVWIFWCWCQLRYSIVHKEDKFCILVCMLSFEEKK